MLRQRLRLTCSFLLLDEVLQAAELKARILIDTRALIGKNRQKHIILGIQERIPEFDFDCSFLYGEMNDAERAMLLTERKRKLAIRSSRCHKTGYFTESLRSQNSHAATCAVQYGYQY